MYMLAKLRSSFTYRVVGFGQAGPTGTKNGLYDKMNGEKRKSTNYRNYVQHRFQTHTSGGLSDEPNSSPKIKGGK